MSEYWKSQPRKLCEFCKCWITDNRPSVEFHERGKKHKENVQKRIEEVQKKGKETFQVRKQLATDLAAIEAAALKAYEKDLNIESSEDKSNSTPESESRPTSTKSHTKGESTAECLISYEGSKPVLQCDHGWSIGQAPEGHYYYYNTETQVSQWVPPSCLSSPSAQECRNSEDSKTCSDEQEKPPQEDVEEIKENQRSEKVKKSPYGQWTTVQTYTPPPKTEVATSTQEKEPTIKTPATEVVKTEVKFKERATPKIAFKSDGANEVTFKKRKLNSEKKRNVRQTDPNKVN